MIFTLASSNQHKAHELQELFRNSNLSVQVASKKVEVVEDADTFRGNALKKAQGYYDLLKTPIISDDSGLVLPARSDILGIKSARYAPELSDYKDKNEHLLKDIASLEGEKRRAYFVCVLCFYLNPKEIYHFEGRVHGVIGQKQQGEKGFGYDPIFYPDGDHGGASLAELEQWKMKNSHRAKAASSAVTFFQYRK